MQIINEGYNIVHVVIPTAITPNVSTKVGTADDFSAIYNAIIRSGIVRVSATIGSVYMDGAMLANGWQNADGVECYTISMAGAESPYIIQAEITLEGGDCYVLVSVHSLT